MPQGHSPLDLIHIWDPLWVPFSLHAGKGKCCMWLVEKVEIHFAKMGFVDCKWSNLNVPGSYTPWSHSLLGSTVGCPFPCMQEKGMVHLAFEKVEIHFAKIGFVDCKWSNLNAPGSYTPWCHSLLGSTVGCPFPLMQEKGNAACGLLIMWKFILKK